MSSVENYEQIDEIILSFLLGKIDAKDLEFLKSWIAISKNNKDYFKKTYLLFNASRVVNKDKEAARKAFQKIYEGTIKSTIHQSGNINNGGSSVVSMLKWAAVIFISLCTGTLITYLNLKNHLIINENLSVNEINVPLGSKSRIVLPDQTEVWLNAGSKLTYSMNYGKKLREVELVGEGYFKVAKMKEKPFIVHTLKADIKALGTEFNVKAYPDENTIEAILVKGTIEVNKILSDRNNQLSQKEQSIVLKPGQKVLIYKNELAELKDDKLKSNVDNSQTSTNLLTDKKTLEKEMSPSESDAEVETSWKDPNWVIHGENLQSFFVKLGRRYNLSIFLIDKNLDKYKFSGTIRNETVEQVFELMSLAIPMSYSIDKGKVEITLNHKLENIYKSAYKN